MPHLEGQTLKGRYRIDELLGRGGMAEVYRAWDTWRNYHVAIKVMREDLAEDLEFLRRFRREATALAQLAHENIVRFYSFEQEGQLAFMVMDYVSGTTLRTEIAAARGPLPLDLVASVAQQVCDALHYAHQEGVIHRDIKPGNIMIRPDGRVLVTDFGIAKAADAATATTVMPGTPAYMAPEQCRSEPLDGRTDIYSLGVVLYEMLGGRRPFVGDTEEAGTESTRERLRWEQMHADPPSLRLFNPTISPQLEGVVLKALAKEREQRWPGVLAFGQALAQVMGRPVHTEAARVSEPAPEPAPERGTQASVAVPGSVLPGGPTNPVLASDARAASHRPGLTRIPPWVWVAGAATLVVLLAVIVLPAIDGVPPTPTSTPKLSDRAATAAEARSVTPPSPASTFTPEPPTRTSTPTNTPSPTATSTHTPTPTPDAKTELEIVIRRSNQAEIDALRTLDTTRLEETMTGNRLQPELDAVQSLRAKTRYQVVRQLNIEFISYDLSDDTHAKVETMEVYTAETYRSRDNTMLFYTPPYYIPQTYSLEKVGDGWLVVDVEFYDDPEHFPRAGGMEVANHLVETRIVKDTGGDYEQLIISAVVRNSSDASLSAPSVFATFYDAAGNRLGYRRAWCYTQVLAVGDTSYCRAEWSKRGAQPYPDGWHNYELKPVGVPADEQAATLIAAEERVVSRAGSQWSVVGQVRNNDSRSVSSVQAVSAFYDDRERLLNVDYAVRVAVQGNVLEPGQVAPFEMLVAGNVARYQLYWRGTVTGMSPRTGLECTDVSRNGPTVTGTLRNRSGETQEAVMVYAVFYDSNQQLLAVASAGGSVDLPDGRSWSFTIPIPDDTSQYDLVVR